MKFKASLILILTTALVLFAEPSLMLSGGLNYSLITGEDSLVRENYHRIGFNAKIGFEQRFVKNFSLIFGISLETRGEENLLIQSFSPTVVQQTLEKINILNLQLPLLAQANFPIGNFCINLFAGPSMAVFLSGEKKRTVTVNVEGIEPKDDVFDFSQKMKMLGLDLEGGIGFVCNTGDRGAVFIRGGAQVGILTIAPAINEPKEYENLNGKNINGYLTAGYKFNLRFDE